MATLTLNPNPVQRGVVMALLFSFIVGPGLWFVTPLLLRIGQPPATVEYAALYLRFLSLTLPCAASCHLMTLR